MEPLNATVLRRLLNENGRAVGVEAAPCVDSTNLRLKEWARAGRVTPPFLLAADAQTAGRGRLGRQFVSPPGGLYMSVLTAWDSQRAPGRLTLLAAVAVCRAIEEMTPLRPGIKWVNDIFVGDKKVCGILAEAAEEYAVIGIGINLISPPGGFPPEAGAAGALDVPVGKNRLAARITSGILSGLDAPDGGAVLSDYKSRMFLIGRQVRFLKNGAEQTALVTGVSEDGGLMVTGKTGDQILRSGEVTISSQSLSAREYRQPQ